MKKRTCLLTWTMIVLPYTAVQSLAQTIYEPYTFTTFAGNADPRYGNADGIGSDARFAYPEGVAVDSAGNVYVADSVNNTISESVGRGSGNDAGWRV